MDKQAVIAATRRWIETIVIGLNLCPFAERVFAGDKIRYVVSDAADESVMLKEFADELRTLADSTTVETTLLIHPCVLTDFLDYNDFLDSAEEQIEILGFSEIIQVASFHPDYQFGDAADNAVENYTNRSPYPMLHLLRNESISAIADDDDELLKIPQRNVETMRALGRDRIVEMLKAIRDG